MPFFAPLLLCGACASQPAPTARPGTAQVPASSGGERAPCPRVERAPRMWTGFLVEVPSEALGRALDVVVPIQNALGALFCAPERADCRPAELQAIELSDERANIAQLRVRLAPGAGELSLTLRVRNVSWEAEPASLAQYLALCRGAPPADDAR